MAIINAPCFSLAGLVLLSVQSDWASGFPTSELAAVVTMRTPVRRSALSSLTHYMVSIYISKLILRKWSAATTVIGIIKSVARRHTWFASTGVEVAIIDVPITAAAAIALRNFICWFAVWCSRPVNTPFKESLEFEPPSVWSLLLRHSQNGFKAHVQLPIHLLVSLNFN